MQALTNPGKLLGLSKSEGPKKKVYSKVYYGSLSTKCFQSTNFDALGDQFAKEQSCASQGFTKKVADDPVSSFGGKFAEEPDVYVRPNKL